MVAKDYLRRHISLFHEKRGVALSDGLEIQKSKSVKDNWKPSELPVASAVDSIAQENNTGHKKISFTRREWTDACKLAMQNVRSGRLKALKALHWLFKMQDLVG